MAKRKSKKSKNGKLIIVVAIILVIIIAAMAILYYVKPEIYDAIFELIHTDSPYDNADSGDSDASSENDNGNSGSADSDSGNTDSGGSDVTEGNAEDIVNADLSIHFLELGNKYTGDCTLIKCGDTEVLIDAGSKVDSAPTISSYISQYCNDGKLEYVVATHAHEDHIAGFVGKSTSEGYNGILYNYEVGTIIEFAKTNSTSTIYANYCTARDYAVDNGAVCYTALQCYNNTDGASRQYYLNTEETISINVLYNYYYENKASTENNYSVCILLTQKTDSGETLNYLFTGDLESGGESYLVDNNDLPHVELFKGGHHGSSTSTTDKLLAAITPDNIAICTCVGSTEYGKTNDAHFPTQEFISRICNYTENVYCTTLMNDYSTGDYASMNGNIVFYYSLAEGEEAASLKLWCSNNTTKLKDTDWFAANRKWE
ncbi:MAG: MBL fold metallo-hydrolase [Clostridia bacterium]|nr:MBL fold metallo-hydrolase [Clostridia bacterium]